MQRQNPFKMSALNSLKINQVKVDNQKLLLNTFKGANDLRSQLNKNKNYNTSTFKQAVIDSKIMSKTVKYQKPQQEALMEEVAALDNFKAPVTRQKTKNLIQNIKIRRRQKHIQAYNNFKQDLDDYKQNLLSIYDSLYNDCSQVLTIKQSQFSGYLNSQKDSYLLNREKQILDELQNEYKNYKNTTLEKIRLSKQQIQRIKAGRAGVVDQTCEILRNQLIQIAFVLEDQAKQIQLKQKEEISKLQDHYYEKYVKLIEEAEQRQVIKSEELKAKLEQVKRKWRQIKQNNEIQTYIQDMKSQAFINPKQRQNLYKKLVDIQTQNHNRKRKLLNSLVNQHVDTLRKVNIQKWNELLKSLNDQFDKQLDQIVKQLMTQFQNTKANSEKRLKYLQTRLNYIEFHNEEEVSKMIQQTYQPVCKNNIKEAQQLLKNATNYVQNCDDRQNQALQKTSLFILEVSKKNDDFSKEFSGLNQKYELEKAKVLDDDQQNTQKLNKELEQLKKELRQSLHHLKLEQVQKKCFDKIDELQKAYRQTHQKNKILVSARPGTLNSFISSFESKMAQIYQLYEQSKKNQLILKNKQLAQKQAMKRIQEEDKQKAEQELRQAEQIKKKGGKAPPPPKPKDPKKLAAQIQERKKVLLAQIGEKKIQQLKTQSGNTWLVFKGLQQICSQFFKIKQTQEEKKQLDNDSEQKKQENLGESQKKPLQIDQLPEPIKNCQGTKVVTNQAFLKIKDIANELLTLRDKIFQNIGGKKQRILQEASQNDSQMLEQSLTILDERLKQHYSLKGKLQAQLYVKRSGQITNHKKRYEKYARTTRQKMDLQTQRFNFLLQKSLQMMKSHTLAQKTTREQLVTAKNLSQLQGLLGKSRQNFNNFGIQMKEVLNELSRLGNNQVDFLLKKNQDFIKESKPLKDGGQYSDEQIEWYKQMMKEITDQMTDQKNKRLQKMKQIQDHTQKKKKQLLQKFEKQYQNYIEELAAKDGTGKKYGRPKRMAQQKTRLQMNKCQQAQININRQIDAIIHSIESAKSKGYHFQGKLETLEWRRQLMTVQTCISKYAKHIEGLVPNLKIKSMVRVNYDQNIPDCLMSNQQQDKKRLEKQISQIGPLAEQKEEKPFMKFILDIQKLISDEARLIYVGDKAKYITGNDKLPDFLRLYNANMKKSAEQFRMRSIRELRESCQKLSDLSEHICELFFISIKNYYESQSISNQKQTNKSLQNFLSDQQNIKKVNLKALRPNLSNPKCQGQLKQLNDKELQRQKLFVQIVQQTKKKFKINHFGASQKYLNTIINNYEFLILYFDSLYLHEDFVKVTGDDQSEKQNIDIRKLMLMKQKGIALDTSSERNLKKKWEGINFSIFNFEDKKYVYQKVQEEPKQKDKKGSKKDSKDKKAVEQPVLANQNNTKQIQTFKTWRQKAVFTYRQNVLKEFKDKYFSILDKENKQFEQILKQSKMFETKWATIAQQLFLK